MTKISYKDYKQKYYSYIGTYEYAATHNNCFIIFENEIDQNDYLGNLGARYNKSF